MNFRLSSSSDRIQTRIFMAQARTSPIEKKYGLLNTKMSPFWKKIKNMDFNRNLHAFVGGDMSHICSVLPYVMKSKINWKKEISINCTYLRVRQIQIISIILLLICILKTSGTIASLIYISINRGNAKCTWTFHYAEVPMEFILSFAFQSKVGQTIVEQVQIQT